MAFRFVALFAALACFNVASALPCRAPAPAPCCPRVLPEIHPSVVHTVIPAPAVIGPQAPGVIEHVSHPQELNYFEKPWVVKHKQSAALNVFTQHPVVVDEYAPPQFSEAPAPQAVIVEPVCGSPVNINAGCGGCGSGYAGYGSGYGYGGYGLY